MLVLRHAQSGQTWSLSDGRLVILRKDAEAQVHLDPGDVPLALDDRLVSRRHALIAASDGGFTVTDTNSTDGSYLNDHEVHETAPIADGDRLRFGDTLLSISIERAAPAASAVPQGDVTIQYRPPVAVSTPGEAPPPGPPALVSKSEHPLVSASERPLVLNYLAGVIHPDERLVPLLAPHDATPGDRLIPAHRALSDQVFGVFSGERAATTLVQLCGSDTTAKRPIVWTAAQRLGRSVRTIDAATLPSAPAEFPVLVRLLEREAGLGGWVYLIDCEERDAADSAHLCLAERLADTLRVPVVVATRDRWTSVRKACVVCEVEKPALSEQREIWEEALGEVAARLNGHVPRLVTHFHLGPQAIRDATTEALAREVVEHDREELGNLLWDACRARARPKLDDLAQRIEPSASWQDLVLPEPQRLILHEIAVHVRRRTTVYESWGFAAQSARGLGISALFSGPSGTGKTMAAEVLARELRLDLYRVDLSATVSKYIGETEKNLRRIFDAAEEGGVILLFDEADALFGKRSEVKDSHDRYANIEVGYLLQRMEAYRGLAILTTNLKASLDPAFLRRIRFVVQFPFPDSVQRAEIWRRVFPSRTPTNGLDESQLARLNVGGGNIRNIALGAAFLAAEAGEPVRMPHVLRAAQAEYAKLEKPLTEGEVGEWPRE